MEDIRQILVSVEKVFEVENNRSTTHVHEARYFMKASSLDHVLSTTDVNVPKQLLLTLCTTNGINTTRQRWIATSYDGQSIVYP